MPDFKSALLRLKEQLGEQTDKAVAEILGLQEKAFNARKRRGVFPEKEVYALMAKRPDLRLDAEYILTGKTQLTRVAEGAAASLARMTALKAASPENLQSVMAASEQKNRQRTATKTSDRLESPALTPREAALMSDYRASSPENQEAIERVAAALARER